MKRTFILYLITNLFITLGQSSFLPFTLNDHDHNVWVTFIEDNSIAPIPFNSYKDYPLVIRIKLKA